MLLRHEFRLRYFTLIDNAFERAACKFRVVWNRYCDASVSELATHDDMAAALSHLNEAMFREDFAHLAAREGAQFRHVRVPAALPSRRDSAGA